MNMFSLNMEFVQALNPLYAFPIVAVILCAFIVYAFGFKSPVPPPCFEGIEDEKKTSRKRKTKETNKQGKLIQNGKIIEGTVNKPQISPPGKKKEIEKSAFDKLATEKQSSNEKKTNKKAKSQNEKKNASEKKKETVVNEDNGDGGWVQLVSKKGRKSRKKDEAHLTENQPPIIKPVKNFEAARFDESSPPEEAPKKFNDVSLEKAPKKLNEVSLENSVPEQKSELKEFVEEKGSAEIASSIENAKEKPIADMKSDMILEQIPSKETDVKPGKLIEESSNKSKKKKKKNVEVINTDNKAVIIIPETPAVPVTSEIPSTEATIDSTVTVETSQVVIGKGEADLPKESKSSNVAFDELAGLYPEAKEQRRKKRVRRDH